MSISDYEFIPVILKLKASGSPKKFLTTQSGGGELPVYQALRITSCGVGPVTASLTSSQAALMLLV